MTKNTLNVNAHLYVCASSFFFPRLCRFYCRSTPVRGSEELNWKKKANAEAGPSLSNHLYEGVCEE